MKPYGIRTAGKWNEAYVNMRTFTSPEALKVVKIFKDFKASIGVLGSFMNHFIFL